MSKRGIWLTIAAVLGLVASYFITPAAWACVGRKLTIGYRAGSTEQRIVAEIIAILIEERTGTKVVFKEFEDSIEVHRAIEKNEVQLYVEYVGVGLKEILGEKMADNRPQEVYNRVKRAYKKNFDLIWLKTLGYASTQKDNPTKEAQAVPMEAAPVVRKDTLKKFPALARLLNQLSGRLDNNTLQQMIAQVEKGEKTPKEVAGEILGTLGISFSFTPGQA